MKRLPAAAPADEQGFILVGVVMFMIALTILGLSLFALSSYEAQFFYASQSREQALQSSESGMEVVKSLLSDPSVPSTYRYRLEAAQLAVGHFGITQALAYQARSSDPNDTTSRGPVNWDSTLVIVVSGRAGGEERSVQTRFRPVPNKNPYQQLISAGQGLWYNTKNSTSPTLQLTGAVWQHVVSAADTAWTGFVDWRKGRPLDPSMPAMPTANAFVDEHMAEAKANMPPQDEMNLTNEALPTYFVTFEHAPATAPFYTLPDGSSPPSGEGDTEWNEHYQFYCDNPLEIRVDGTAIWLIDRGVCFGGKVTVVPDPDAPPPSPDNPYTLVIVAKPNPNGSDPNRGIWFQGGLANDSTETRVFLVSDGDISLTQQHSSSSNLNARAVSIVAGGTVELMGPVSGTLTRVAHAASMNAHADDMVASGLLPPPSGGSTSRFAVVPHSWLETRLP
jgi:hypothetical protein